MRGHPNDFSAALGGICSRGYDQAECIEPYLGADIEFCICGSFGGEGLGRQSLRFLFLPLESAFTILWQRIF